MIQPSSEELLAVVAEIRDAAQQRAYISSSGVSPALPLVEAFSNKIRECCPRDPALAEALAETNLYLASLTNDPVAVAYANRSRAQVFYTMRRCAEALPLFARAVDLFSAAGMNREVGRTLVTQMDNLSYLGRYEEAIALERQARSALQRENDRQYLTNLEIALGNLYYRLDRFAESLAHYDQALQSDGEPVALAAAGMGRAHVLTDLNRFDEAIETFEATRQRCGLHGLALWGDIADHGISRMHFLRGNYSAALSIVERLRKKHEANGDTRRVAICDLDRAEIYLQLNLFDDAAALAGNASQTFRQLDNRYEAAMCLLFLGIAEFKRFNDSDAERAFVSAREMFSAEGNEIFTAMVDLWRAQLLVRQRYFAAARELAAQSVDVLEKRQAPVRAANARVLAAQCHEGLLDNASAIAEAERALAGIAGFHAPWVSYQIYNTLGRLNQIGGNAVHAEQLYLQAIAQLESLGGNIRLDELRMSFGKDKYQVYENIVGLKLARGDARSAFGFVERSKSRTLIDLLERNIETVWDTDRPESPLLREIQKVREELNLLYNRLNDVVLNVRSVAADRAAQREIEARERKLTELLRELGSEKSGWVSLRAMSPVDVEATQAMLGPGEALLEYYSTGGRLHAFAIAHDDFEFVPDIGAVAPVRAAISGIGFQLSKFNLQASYLETHSVSLLAAMKYHLGALYHQLIRPFEAFLRDRPHLTIVPHHALHYVPFHALHDGNRYLIDTHEVSYAPSASVLKICRERAVHPNPGRDLVLAAGDERTPHIQDEVAALRKSLPEARILIEKDAGESAFRQFAPEAGKIHIAAHGIFRADNPMFSSLRLGDAWLNLFDIFNVRLNADIVTLSACETGMNAIFEGDELLGLARGFLYAGAPSLVVSLWMVNDRSTSVLMGSFYRGLQQGLSKRQALREAILEVKAEFPHPYYWAPFILLGKP